MQWWNKQRIIVTDIPTANGRKWRKEFQLQVILKSNQANSIRLQGLGIILCGWRFCPLHLRLHPLHPRLCPQSHPPFFLEDGECLRLSTFISLCPTCRILGVPQPPFIWFSLCLTHLKLAVFLLIEHSRNACGSTVYASRTPFDWRIFHRSFLDNPISIPGFCWDARGDPWVTCLISSKSPLCEWIFWSFHPPEALAKGCPATPLAFPLGHTVSFVIWIGWKFPKLWSPGSFMSNSSFLKLCLSSCLFTKSSKKKSSHTFSSFTWNPPQINYQVHPLQVLLSTQISDTTELSFLPLYNKLTLSSSFQKHIPCFLLSPHQQCL